MVAERLLVQYAESRGYAAAASVRRGSAQAEVRALFDGLDVEFVAQSHIFPGCDNWAERGLMGRLFRDVMHLVESSPLRRFGISHFFVVRKRA